MHTRTQHRFSQFAWFNLFWNLGVILWGTYVRATGSGAGCGAHWPTCSGALIPREPAIETLIELTHRATSGLSLVFVVLLALWAWRAWPAGSRPRRAAGAGLLFMLAEAGVGAALVLLKLVADDASVLRAVVMAVHLVNTFMLLAALFLTARWSSALHLGRGAPPLRARGIVSLVLGLGLAAAVLLGVSGAITALGDTLFPATTLLEGVTQDFSSTAHFLLRLRVLHPLLAVGTAGLWLGVLLTVLWARRTRTVVTLVVLLVLGLCAQLVVGVVNMSLLAPVPLQVIHLLLADTVWLLMVAVAAATLEGARA